MRLSTQLKLATWLADHENVWKCECGCGEYITPTVFHFNHRSWYRPRFVPKHQNRGKNHPPQVGRVIAKGYVWFRMPKHRLANPRGYVKRCWLVAEKNIGRHLRDDEVVHHKDGNKLNDSPDNIAVVGHYEHRTHHSRASMNPRYRHDIDTERDILPRVRKGHTFKQIASDLKCSQRMVMMRLHHEGIWVHPWSKGVSGRKPFCKAA